MNFYFCLRPRLGLSICVRSLVKDLYKPKTEEVVADAWDAVDADGDPRVLRDVAPAAAPEDAAGPPLRSLLSLAHQAPPRAERQG